MPNPDPEQVLADIRASARIGAEIRQLTANLRRSIIKNWHACADQENANARLLAADPVEHWSCLRSAARYRAEAEIAQAQADRTTSADDIDGW